MAVEPPFANTPLLLDTDVFTDWRNQRPHIISAIKEYSKRTKSFPMLAAITIFESQFGFDSESIKGSGLSTQLMKERGEMEHLIQTCGVLNFNQAAATIAAYIFARLSKSQRNRHWRDVFIVATALAHNYGVATRNQRDFELIGQHLPPYAPVLYLAIWKS